MASSATWEGVRLRREEYRDGPITASQSKLASPGTAQEANLQVTSLQDKHSSQFIPWLADDQNLSAPVVEIPPKALKLAAASMSNHTSIQTMLKRIADQFTLLFKKKQYLNWYTGEGMDEPEFTEAEVILQDLIAAYANCQNTFDDSESDT